MDNSSVEKQKFLVTGASSGLGLAIALEAAQNGHSVIGTARNAAKAAEQHPEFAQARGRWMQLDLTAPNAQEVVQQAMEHENIDVLINNAGYGLYGAVEDESEQEIRDQFETNFFGTLKVIKGAIPHFRRRRSGTLVTMSSISGLTVTSASGTMYASSKFALEAVSEGLALQLAPFGVRVLLVEPGLFRTNWLAGSYVTPAKGLEEDYVGGPVDDALTKYPTIHGAQDGDPAKAARAIVEVVTGTGVGAREDVKGCLRLPLGNDAMDKAREYVDKLTRELDAVESIARSMSYDKD